MKQAGYRLVAIDQHTQSAVTVQKRAWFPVGSRPRLAVSGVRQSVNLLGAVADTGQRVIQLVAGRLTAETTIDFLDRLQAEFGTKLVVVLDNAGYFVANSVKAHAATADIRLEYLPPYAPDLNPVEQCWRQLNQARANRVFRSLSELTEFLTAALPSLSSPRLSNYLC